MLTAYDFGGGSMVHKVSSKANSLKRRDS
jgi:hypothetical protein